MTFSLILYFAILLVQVHSQAFTKKFAGPFDGLCYKTEKCLPNQKDLIGVSTFRISKHNRTTASYTGNITLPIDIDDDVQLKLNVAELGNGGWKDGMYRLVVPHLCTDAKRLAPVVLYHIIGHFGRTDCPIPKGFYQVIGLTTNVPQVAALPVAPYGKYRVQVSIWKYNKKYVCFYLFYSIKPKGT